MGAIKGHTRSLENGSSTRLLLQAPRPIVVVVVPNPNTLNPN